MKERLRLIVISALFGAAFGAFFSIFVPELHDLWFEKHPDTRIHQIVSDEGPWIIIENRGRAVDRVMIDIRVPGDVIDDIYISDDDIIRLAAGGRGNEYAKFTINELWPNISHAILVKTLSPSKFAADVKGYSLVKEDVEEEIPVIRVK